MSSFRYDNGMERRHRWRKLFLFLIVMVVLAAGLSVITYRSLIVPVDSSDSEVVEVVVEEGMNEAQFAGVLHDKGLIKSPLAYEVYARLNRKLGQLQAGPYELSKSMSVAEIVDKVVSGDIAVRLVTILPGQRLDQIKDSLVEQGFSVADIESALDPAQYSDHPVLKDKPPLSDLEGYIYPESFQVTSQTKLETVIRSSLDQLNQVISPDMREKFDERGLSLHDAIILASMVEKEVSNTQDKPTVAQVFLRRLDIGMMLGSDVTAYYGAIVAGLPETVATDTPYNTRIYPGFPPGPISNMGLSSLYAVANPSDTDYLFFVAGDDGKTYFSRTVAEHEALAAEHCIVLCAIP